MSQSDVLTEPPAEAKVQRSTAEMDHPLARAVGRVPVKVRTKLLVAFVGIAALLVAVAVLGLRVLGQSNSRVESLGTLQLRAATYQSLQTQAQQLRQLLALRVAKDPSLNAYLGVRASGALTGRSWTLVDQTIAAALSQLGPATNETRFGFVPPPEDEARLDRVRSDYRRFSATLNQIIALDRAGTPSKRSQPLLTDVINADNDLGALTDQLATTTRARTDALISQSRSSYAASRNLFIGVGAGSVVLALALGIVLSWSLIGPIQRTEARLAEIAAGDFSRHVEVPNRDELGALALNLNLMNDELKRLYEDFETVSRHKSDFLANMSHELRTPLNAIIGFSELLQQQMVGELNEQQLGYVDDVLEAGRHLLSLINEILDLAKVEAGKMELDVSDFSLRDAIESGLAMHAERAGREGIALGLRLDPAEITIRADERKLRQVVFNLLSNAVKFTPAGGRVDVSAQMTDGIVEVAVTDTGPGIAPEDYELIFEEFRQARGDSTKRNEGTGLGLPLSRKLIELQAGRLWVESVQGEGSTFRFTLPVEPPA
jgi:signal transduction histidine kinase